MTRDTTAGRRLLTRAGRVGHRLLSRTPARRLLETEAVRRLRIAAGREMPASAVREVLAALESAGVPHWVVGGWGVDALVGRQTRRHGDLDIVVDRNALDVRARAQNALRPLGLQVVAEEQSLPPMSTIWVFSDGVGRTVDLLPVDLADPPFAVPGALTTGTIDGAPAPCIAAETQRQLRAGYAQRVSDAADLEALNRLSP